MAVAHKFASKGYDIQLAARNLEHFLADKSDLEYRHQVSVSLHEFDALNLSSHEALLSLYRTA